MLETSAISLTRINTKPKSSYFGPFILALAVVAGGCAAPLQQFLPCEFPFMKTTWRYEGMLIWLIGFELV
jgi:hypothetical protein